MAQDPSLAWQRRYQLWLSFVRNVEGALAAGNAVGTGPSFLPMIPPEVEPTIGSPKKVVICSPHPDDEALVGALPLRLRLETGAEVVNCAITLGSNNDERPRRIAEVEASCSVLGFRLIVPNRPHGLDNVRPETRNSDTLGWADNVRILAEIFDQERPEIVFVPHAGDFHPAHIGAYYLALESLRTHLHKQGRGPVMLIETEYWHELSEPNLMVGITAEIEAILVMATAEHGGEVTRNPYHLRHPARLIDNARRGAEVVGKPGGPGCVFQFAELYRVSFVKEGQIVPARKNGLILEPAERIDMTRLMHDFSTP
jgi:LmbE family N-acetylglucosaminyl deacetylase